MERVKRFHYKGLDYRLSERQLHDENRNKTYNLLDITIECQKGTARFCFLKDAGIRIILDLIKNTSKQMSRSYNE